MKRTQARSTKVLLLADTHLGFDLPTHPRVQRRRRGHDFFANYHRALQPALRGEVDLLVHGGDLFYRSRVPDWLVEKAIEPLIQVADSGVPVFIVPGNHERSRLPLHLWMTHPQMHIFDRPRTFVHQTAKGKIALSGFPFVRRARSDFSRQMEQSEWNRQKADAHLLCIHQAVEGAQVGAHNYTFRSGSDVVRLGDIPQGLTAVLSGHIHRAQVLRHDLRGSPIPTPVIYAGSIERTSFAERNEEKGYMILDLPPARSSSDPLRGGTLSTSFAPLPTRPMVVLDVSAPNRDLKAWRANLKRRFASLPPDAVVRLNIDEAMLRDAEGWLTAQQLRDLAPETMNVSMPRALARREREGETNA